jgi:hypothetical protein
MKASEPSTARSAASARRGLPTSSSALAMAAIDSVPLKAPGLPDSTCALLAREATH